MSYRVKALTSADIVGMRLQERSMKADANHKKKVDSCFISCVFLVLLVILNVYVAALTSIDTIGMRSQKDEGRHGPGKHES